MPFFIVFGHGIRNPSAEIGAVRIWDEAFPTREAAVEAIQQADDKEMLWLLKDSEFLVVEASNGSEAGEKVLWSFPPDIPPA